MTIGITLDSRDPHALAPFWATALGYAIAGSVENYVSLHPEGGDGPRLLLQSVPEAKAHKNRLHVDIEVADIEAAATTLMALGATRLEGAVRHEYNCRWIVMADPEGNEFCLCCTEPKP